MNEHEGYLRDRHRAQRGHQGALHHRRRVGKTATCIPSEDQKGNCAEDVKHGGNMLGDSSLLLATVEHMRADRNHEQTVKRQSAPPNRHSDNRREPTEESHWSSVNIATTGQNFSTALWATTAP